MKEHALLCGEYQALLGILQELNSHLTILYEPEIALPAHVLDVADAVDAMLSTASLPRTDGTAIREYLDNVEAFCNVYFERPARASLGAICPLRLPCDSHDLLEAFENLHWQFLSVRACLRSGLWDSGVLFGAT